MLDGAGLAILKCEQDWTLEGLRLLSLSPDGVVDACRVNTVLPLDDLRSELILLLAQLL